MKIKKQYQSIVPDGKIMVNKTESDIDTYSCNYINEINDKSKILWTNPNPTSTYTTATVTLSNSDWDAYEVIYSHAASTGSNTMSTGIVPKGRNAGCVSVGFANSYPLIAYRQIKYIDQSSMLIGYDAHTSHSYGGTSTGNEYCIPLYIIGHKTGLFN